MNQPTPELTIRELNSVEELKRSEAFQREVWGQDDPADNSDIMLAIQHEGDWLPVLFPRGACWAFSLVFQPVNPMCSIRTD